MNATRSDDVQISRRSLLALGGALLVAACAKSGEKLIVGDQKGGLQPLLREAGLLDDVPYPIEWAQFPNTGPMVEALSGGAVDVGGAGDFPFLFSLQSIHNVKAISASRATGPAATILVRGDSPIRRFADLIGRTVATTRGSVGHNALLSGLQRMNRGFDAIDIVFVAPGDGRAALSGGSIDAWAVWEPYATIGIMSDGFRIVDTDADLTKGLGFTLANTQTIEHKRPLLLDLVQRQRKATTWAAQNRSRYASMMTKETGLPIAVTTRMVTRTVYAPTPMDDRLVDDMTQTRNLLQSAGLLKSNVDLSNAFDRSFGA